MLSAGGSFAGIATRGLFFLKEDILSLSATELLARMKCRDLSSSDLIEMTLDRIDKFNPQINAIVSLDRERALSAAAKADRRWKDGTAGSLEGIPVTIKDSFDVEGLPATAGSPLYRNRSDCADAPAVARLRQAGAIIIGKTNVSEMLGDLQSSNPLFGKTSNPNDLAYSAGGSSGGSAASVAAGLSSFDLGSDLCGSIRWPAQSCGLFALKPGWGVVPMFGHVPPPPGTRTLTELSTGGPFARSASDLGLIFSVLSGKSVETAPVDRPLRVAVWTDEPLAPCEPEIFHAVVEAANRMREAGAIVDFAARPAFGFAEALELFLLLVYRILALGLSQVALASLANTAKNTGSCDLTHASLRARGSVLSDADWTILNLQRAKIQRDWASFFVEWDVVICPAAPRSAIKHNLSSEIHDRTVEINGTKLPYFSLTNWSCLASIADLPAAVVPFSSAAHNLPAGVQIISATGKEAMALKAARQLEQHGFGYKAPKILV